MALALAILIIGLLEKTKLRFDSEGIRFAFPQLDLHINSDRSLADARGSCADAAK